MDEYRNLVHTAHRHLQLELSSGTGPFTQGRRIAIRQGRAQYSNGTRALESLQSWELARQQVRSTQFLKDAMDGFHRHLLIIELKCFQIKRWL